MKRTSEPFDTGLGPDDLSERKPRPLRTPWGELALYPTDSGVRAASAWCPHLFGPLIEGTREGDLVTCPWHLWTFSLVDGRCSASPRGEGQGSRLLVAKVSLGPTGTYWIHPPEEPRPDSDPGCP